MSSTSYFKKFKLTTTIKLETLTFFSILYLIIIFENTHTKVLLWNASQRVIYVYKIWAKVLGSVQVLLMVLLGIKILFDFFFFFFSLVFWIAYWFRTQFTCLTLCGEIFIYIYISAHLFLGAENCWSLIFKFFYFIFKFIYLIFILFHLFYFIFFLIDFSASPPYNGFATWTKRNTYHRKDSLGFSPLFTLV